MTLLWWRGDTGNGFQTFATSSNTPEAIAKMQAAGFIPRNQRIEQLISEHKRTHG